MAHGLVRWRASAHDLSTTAAASSRQTASDPSYAMTLGCVSIPPTVNLFMTPRDFVRLAADPEGHLGLNVEYAGSPGGYTVGMYGDVRLHFLHYASFEEACECWHRRAARVNLMNSRWIQVDRDGLDEETVRDFDALDLPCKVILIHRRWDSVRWAFVCPRSAEIVSL